MTNTSEVISAAQNSEHALAIAEAGEMANLIEEASKPGFENAERRIKQINWNRTSYLKNQMAQRFGRLHGWKLSNGYFTLSQLARRSNQRRMGDDAHHHHHCVHTIIDHPFWYREIVKPYRPAAMAVHLYDWPESGPDIEAVCSELSLRYEAIVDFPSWWYPGATQLVLYTPLNAVAVNPGSRHVGATPANRNNTYLQFARDVPAIYRHGRDYYWDGWTAFDTDGQRVHLCGELGSAMRRLVREGFYGDLSHLKKDSSMCLRIQDALAGYPMRGINKEDCEQYRISFPGSVIAEQDELCRRIIGLIEPALPVSITRTATQLGVSAYEIRYCVMKLLQGSAFVSGGKIIGMGGERKLSR